MKYKFIFVLISLTILSCEQKNNLKESELIQKENGLLKREIEVIKKENALQIPITKDSNSEISNKKLEFKTFYNYNRDFKIDYPAFLTMGAASENADGRDFITNGGEISLYAYSSYNMDKSISELYNEELRNDNYTLTYKVLKSNWYVISGVDNSNRKEFYEKVFFSSKYGNQIRTMILEYPKTKQKDFDIIIPRLLKSFKDI